MKDRLWCKNRFTPTCCILSHFAQFYCLFFCFISTFLIHKIDLFCPFPPPHCSSCGVNLSWQCWFNSGRESEPLDGWVQQLPPANANIKQNCCHVKNEIAEVWNNFAVLLKLIMQSSSLYEFEEQHTCLHFISISNRLLIKKKSFYLNLIHRRVFYYSSYQGEWMTLQYCEKTKSKQLLWM